ncbi:17539_t:CDS:2 [Funneliformis geosporum]|uniref:17539_t:CDS:1 n=1 Tax=Funneliformis geosporum TaxID=1117311 RepID=A0A9W4SRJ0_9GLOM|nr:17539_t:CDS:2 [Funneliformis geosporum]
MSVPMSMTTIPLSMPKPTKVPLPMPTPSINNEDSSVSTIARFVYSGLFTKETETQKNVIETCFDDNAVFENPMILVESRDKIINQFLLLSTFFHSVTPEIHSITSKETEGNHHLVCIDSLIKYCLPLPCLRSKLITQRVITKFEFNEQKKIIRHEDIWSLKDMVESLPVIGWLYTRVARKLNGMVTGGVILAIQELKHAWKEWH